MRTPFLTAILVVATTAFAANERLVVHEWGTFTSLQDETGRSTGYLNSSVEPLPSFVHRLRSGLIAGDRTNDFGKSIGYAAHPEITMRLETPVIYFYPQDKTAPTTIDVTATFNGGVLSEFYPTAKFHIEGGTPAPAGLDRFTPNLHGALTWKDLRIGGDVKLPETKEHVWLAPRAVNSARVSAGKEGEQYIFYRGVGNVESPLKVSRRDDQIVIATDAASQWKPRWLAEFRADGTCAFRPISDMRCGGGPAPTIAAGTFKDSDFSKNHAAELRAELRNALRYEGLFDDEADAMLNTWERSYFQGVGQRVFFIVPREWTDRALPLKFSVPVELTRVMIGRIELVTPAQRRALAAVPDAKSFNQLGRFGYAMVLDELKNHPRPALTKFAADNGITAFSPPSPPATQPVACAVPAPAVPIAH